MHASTILIVDDNEDDVFFLKRQLLAARISNPLQVLTDGDEAMQYIDGQGPYLDRARFPLPILMLLDLKMARKTGFDVLEWMKTKQTKVPTIVLSGAGEVHQMSRAFQLGASAFLVKPMAFRLFDNAIKKVRGLALREEGPQVCLRLREISRTPEVCRSMAA